MESKKYEFEFEKEIEYENENEMQFDEESDVEVDLEALESELEGELAEELSDLDILQSEREKINDPNSLGEAVMEVVWDQFILQVGAVAGDDFVRENRGLHFSMNPEDHIQTTSNFEKGKIADHNRKIDYQERYDQWQSKLKHNEDGSVQYHTTRTGEQEATLAPGARDVFDKSRPTGSVERGTDMDHTVSAGEIIRDSEAATHLSEDEQVRFANSDANLNEMDSSLNRSKGDKSMTDWLDNPNSKGQKPSEIFDIDEELDQKMRDDDVRAREAYDEVKGEGMDRSVVTGLESMGSEAVRMGGKAARAAVMALLVRLIRNIIGRLIKWFKSAERTVKSLIASIKEAIEDFFVNFKEHFKSAKSSIVSAIGQAIIGPLFGMIRKAILILKQGWKSLKEAFRYLRNPENKGKSFTVKMLEIGKIVIAGFTAGGAIILGELIEKGLLAMGLHVHIPLLGSLANILGIFFGAVGAGIIGALALHKIDKYIAKKQREENSIQQIAKQNEILQTQSQLMAVTDKITANKKSKMVDSMMERHSSAHEHIRESVNTILEDAKQSEADRQNNSDILNDLMNDLSQI